LISFTEKEFGGKSPKDWRCPIPKKKMGGNLACEKNQLNAQKKKRVKDIFGTCGLKTLFLIP
jgi:hypothetical protein